MTQTDFAISRRTLVKGAAVSALTVPFTFQFGTRNAKALTASDTNFVNAHVSIDSLSDRVTIYIGSTEMGQGIMTGMAQIVAEQLDLDWSNVVVEHGTPDTRIGGGNPYALIPTWGQITGGSTSTRIWYWKIGAAAANVRKMLIDTAAQKYGGTWSLNGNSSLKKDGTATTIKYRDLVADAHNYYFVSNTLTVPTTEPILNNGKFIGKSQPRVDIPAKINGTAVFGIDVTTKTKSTLVDEAIGRDGTGANAQRNGKLLYAAVIHAPKIGGTCATVPASTISGVSVVGLRKKASDNENGPYYAIGVVSPIGTYEAFQAAKSIASRIVWTYPSAAELSKYDSAKIKTQAMSLSSSDSLNPVISGPAVNDLLFVETTDGPVVNPQTWQTTITLQKAIDNKSDTLSDFNSSPIKIDQTYTLPNLAHACMEVLNCTARVKDVTAESKTFKCELWAPTQGQDSCARTAAAFLGLDPVNDAHLIRVNTTYLGGGLGRKIEQDYIGQAVQLSKEMGRRLRGPVAVKLVWQREQDFTNDRYRPSSVIRVRMSAAMVGGNPIVKAYIHRNVSPSIGKSGGSNPEATGDCAGAVGLPYTFSKRIVENVTVANEIPLGYWRSVGESYNTFAIESAIDELARASGKPSFADSIQFRLNNLDSSGRPWKVVDELRKLTEAVPQTSGSARGMAFLEGFGSFIALAIEVSGTTTSMKINRVLVSLDCGLKINPDSIIAQVEGGVVHGLSSTLWGKMLFTSGAPSASNFDRYRLMRMPEAPPVRVEFVPGSDSFAPGGVGEAPVPLIAPALANAYARLLGTRKRDLPFN